MSDDATTGFAAWLRQHPGYPVAYMFAVTFLFSAILIGFARLTAGRVDANRQIVFEKAVLLAVGAEIGESPAPPEIHRMFQTVIREPTAASGGAHLYVRDGAVAAYALPLAGQGFWNVIKGVVGVGPDMRALTGIAFYEQNETPGLGAEIVKPYFRARFTGLQTAPGPQPVALKPLGSPLEGHEVHAITGATQTCRRLETILNNALNAWRESMKD